MSKAQLIEMARHSLAHAKAGTIEQAAEVFKVLQSNHVTDIPHLNFTIGVILHKLHRLAKICFLQSPDTSDFDELATF